MRIPSAPDDFVCMAIFPVRNEIDIIEYTVGRLLEQGVHVIVWDNWSDDGTFEALCDFNNIKSPLLSVMRYPVDGPSEYFDLKKIIEDIEVEAAKYPGSWQIHQGSDEVILPPWPGVNIRDGLYAVDRAGYTVVGLIHCNFRPTTDGFKRGDNPEDFFTHFEYGETNRHWRLWKQPKGRVNLAEFGGHDIRFDGKKTYPEKFIAKHYPLRSQAHGERKIEERFRRYHPDARKRGWHIHYNHFHDAKHPAFIMKKKDLKSFQKTFPELGGISMGSKRKKAYLDPDRSDRAAVLWDEVKDVISEDAKILELGPGIGTMTGYINDDVKEVEIIGVDTDDENVRYAKKAHKGKKLAWLVGGPDDVDAERHYDVVLHTAMSSIGVAGDLWRVHERLANGETGPDYVLLEAGDYKQGGSDPVRALDAAKKFYLDAGYEEIVKGNFHVIATDEGFPIPHRFYSLIKRTDE